MAEVSVTHESTRNGGIYVAHLAGETATGRLEWAAEGEGVRVATHTIVPREIGGRGVAGVLVDRLVEDARQQGFRIVPQCSFVAAKFAEHPEWADLRA